MYYILTKFDNPTEIVDNSTLMDDEYLATFRSMVNEKHHVRQRADAALKLLDAIEDLIENGIIFIRSAEEDHNLHIICDPMIAGLATVILADNEFGDVHHHVGVGASDIVIDLNNPEFNSLCHDNTIDAVRGLFRDYITKSREEYKRLIDSPEIAIGLLAHPILPQKFCQKVD